MSLPYLLPRWSCDALPIEAKPAACPSCKFVGDRPCPGHAPTARIRLAAKVLAWQDGCTDLYALDLGAVEDWLTAAAEALHEIGENR